MLSLLTGSRMRTFAHADFPDAAAWYSSGRSRVFRAYPFHTIFHPKDMRERAKTLEVIAYATECVIITHLPSRMGSSHLETI